MDLLERYLQAIRKHLPARRQDDILAELRANLESQLEERESDLGRRLTEGEMIDWLKQLGAPMRVAARYQPLQYLIGPTIFPMYLYVLRLALLWSLAIYAVVSIVLLWIDRPVAGTIAGAIAGVPGTMFTVAAWVTLVFAVLEYLLAHHPDLLPNLEGISKEWSPATLPPLGPHHAQSKRPRYFVQACAEVIFGYLFLVWLMLVPKYPVLILGPSLIYLHTGPFALAPTWWTFYWVILVFNFAQVVWNTIELARGTWRQRMRSRQIIFKFYSLAPLGVLLAAPNRIYVVLKHPMAGAARYGSTLNSINACVYLAIWILFLVTAVQWCWEIFLWIRDSRQAAGSRE